MGEHAHRREHVAGPQGARRARRAARDRQAAPRQLLEQHLAVGVEHAERHDVGEPVVGVAHDLDVAHRGRGPPHPVDERARTPSSAAATASACCHASAAARTSGTHGAACSRPCSASRRGPGRPQRVPVRTASSPSGGPPNDAASATTTAPASGGDAVRVAPGRRGRVEQQGDAVLAAEPVDRRRRAGGCPPRRWRSGARRRRRHRPRARRHTPVSTRPWWSTGTGDSAPGWSSSTERSVAPATTRAPTRRRAWRSPVRPVSRAPRGSGAPTARRGEPPARWRAPHGPGRAGRGRGDRAGSAGWGRPSRRPGRPEGLRGGGVQGAPGGVEQPGHRAGRTRGAPRLDGSPALTDLHRRWCSRVWLCSMTSSRRRVQRCASTTSHRPVVPGADSAPVLLIGALSVAALSGCAAGNLRGDASTGWLPPAVTEGGETVTTPVDRRLDRGPGRRRPRVGPDHLVRRGLPPQQGRQRAARAAALQHPDRDPLHGRPDLHGRGALLLHRARRVRALDTSTAGRRHGQRRRQAVELGLQLRRGRHPRDRRAGHHDRRARRPGDHPDALPAGRRADRVRAHRARRHPLVLGARLPARRWT